MDWRGNAVLDHFFARRDLTTERGDLDDLLAEPDVCQSKTTADDPAVAEELFDLIRMRRRADVEVFRPAAQQQIADAAADQIRQARLTPQRADAADLVAARAYLERFRMSVASDDLTNARDRLARLDPQRLAPRERAEYIIGLGEALYLDGAYGAAANVFDSILNS